jgi:predicted DCC family thiol-disulfide oxidoreductase YuxK
MFAALQSERGRKLLETTDVQEKGISSLILIDGDKFYTRSDAVLRIAGYMKGIWKLSLVFFILPRIIRDTAYQLIESRRYIWFGKRNSCRIPTSVETKKFLL